ncbi:hypothetical protein AB0E10_44210 [Streptomyces sp. NPDC048045]|uniref:hypothetical protein n=1 Tax=Streptomyces sp. NPDC048045 TaxID=3154710 RepID=UPI0034488DD6
MSTWNGIGTKYLGFGDRNRDGSHHATEWFVLLDLPVVPLHRRRLTVGHTVYTPIGNGSRSVTRYIVHEETPLDGREIVRTYLIWWLLGPLVAGGPAALLLWSVRDKQDGGFGFWAFVLGISVAWVMGAAVAMTTYNRRRRSLPK